MVMTLYIRPGACSLASHIILREVGEKFDLVEVDLATKKTATGDDFLSINPKGQVPALRLPEGTLLTEGPSILQYLADTHPEAGLLPPVATVERYEVLAWLNYVGTELHKSFSPLMRPDTPDDFKPILLNQIAAKFDMIERYLADRDWLVGTAFSVADAYLFTISSWAWMFGFGTGKWPNLDAYRGRIAARSAVHDALVAEGLA